MEAIRIFVGLFLSVGLLLCPQSILAAWRYTSLYRFLPGLSYISRCLSVSKFSGLSLPDCAGQASSKPLDSPIPAGPTRSDSHLPLSSNSTVPIAHGTGCKSTGWQPAWLDRAWLVIWSWVSSAFDNKTAWHMFFVSTKESSESLHPLLMITSQRHVGMFGYQPKMSSHGA